MKSISADYAAYSGPVTAALPAATDRRPGPNWALPAPYLPLQGVVGVRYIYTWYVTHIMLEIVCTPSGTFSTSIEWMTYYFGQAISLIV